MGLLVGVVQAVEGRPRGFHLVLRRLFRELHPIELLELLPERDERLGLLLLARRNLLDVDVPRLDLPDLAVSGELERELLLAVARGLDRSGRGLRFVGERVEAGEARGQRLDRLVQLLNQIARRGDESRLIRAVHRPFKRQPSEQHLGVGVVVLVQIHQAQLAVLQGLARVIGHRVPEALRGGERRPVLLAEHQNVGRDLGSGVLLEGVVGQADRRDQVGAVRGPLAELGRCVRVQRALAADFHHEAARLEGVDRAGQHVVVQAELREPLVVGAIGRERHVADDEVLAVGLHRGLLEPDVVQRGLGVELAEHPPRELVQFHERHAAAVGDLAGHQADHMADASAVLEHPPAGEPQLLDHAPEPVLDDLAAGVVGVEGRGRGGVELLVAEQVLGLLVLVVVLLAPVDRALVNVADVPAFLLGLQVVLVPRPLDPVEHLREPAPPDVLGENLLLVRRGVAVLGLECLEQLDRPEVGLDLGDVAAGDQGVVRPYAVISV